MKPTENIEQLLEQINVTPDPQADSQKLNAILKAQADAQKQTPAETSPEIWRTIMRNPMTKLTAAAAVLIIGVVLFTQLIVVSPSFAEVVKPILNAQTMIYDFLIGGEDSHIVMHDIVSGSRIRRNVSNMPNVTMIVDTDTARMLHLDNQKMEALYFDTTGPMQRGTRGYLKFLRQVIRDLQENPEFAPRKLGTKTIDGRKMIGYAVGDEHKGLEVWADTKTALPVLIKITFGKEVTILKNFEFDVPVADSLVSTEVPAGYKLVEKQNDFFKDISEQDFINGLKVWVELFRDGTFPPSITGDKYIELMPQLEAAVAKLNLSEEEAEAYGTSFVKGMMFMKMFYANGSGTWHYAGKGVKLGDGRKAIFWYRPKGSQTYRVVYGDLSVKDIAPENLPK